VNTTRNDPADGNVFDTGLPMVAGLPAVTSPTAAKKSAPPPRRSRRPKRPNISDTEIQVWADDQLDPTPPPLKPEVVVNSWDQEVYPSTGEDDRREGAWDSWLSEPGVRPPAPPAAEPRIPRGIGDDTPAIPDADESTTHVLIDRTGARSGATARARRRHDHDRAIPASGQRPALRAVLILVALAVVVLCVVLTVITAGRSHHPRSAAPAPVPVIVDPAASDGCQQHPAGSTIMSGTPSGGTDSGPAAIFGFERALYVARSGQQAARFLAGSSVGASNVAGQRWIIDADELQRGLADLPASTRYCVQIRRVNSDNGSRRWEVRVTKQLPGAPPRTFAQLFTTDGAAITAIYSN